MNAGAQLGTAWRTPSSAPEEIARSRASTPGSDPFMAGRAPRRRELPYFADNAPSAGNGQSMPDEEHLNYTLRRRSVRSA